MGRRIIYKIEDRPGNSVTESEWADIQKLQHWYNSEFQWSTGKLAFKRHVLFPNTEEFSDLDQSVWELISQRHQSLQAQGFSEHEVVAQLEKDRLVFVKWGGYFDGCIASGFTRVADNEWNAYLVCDFLLKASTLCPSATFQIIDEGKFVKTGTVWLRNGVGLLPKSLVRSDVSVELLVEERRVFSIVNAQKYDKHPAFRNLIPEFNSLELKERRALVRNWNWLGYEDSYDAHGDDLKGFNLNSKVQKFEIIAV